MEYCHGSNVMIQTQAIAILRIDAWPSPTKIIRTRFMTSDTAEMIRSWFSLVNEEAAKRGLRQHSLLGRRYCSLRPAQAELYSLSLKPSL